MPHLTRLHLDPQSRYVSYDLQNRQGLHSRVMSLVADQDLPDARQRAGLLFRLEANRYGHTLMLQSHNPLDLNALPPGYTTGTEERNLRTLLEWIAPGCSIRYRIDAQASVARRPQEGPRNPRGRRYALIGPAAEAWWMRASRQAGLDIPTSSVNFRTLPDIAAYKEQGGHNKKITFRFTRFEGVAKVIDADSLRQAIGQGIGRNRAYGAGLLSIAPLNA